MKEYTKEGHKDGEGSESKTYEEQLRSDGFGEQRSWGKACWWLQLLTGCAGQC